MSIATLLVLGHLREVNCKVRFEHDFVMLIFLSQLFFIWTIIDEEARGNCGHYALLRCLHDHGCLSNDDHEYYWDNMTKWRSGIVNFWNANYHNFRQVDPRLQRPGWRLVASYPDGTPLQAFKDGRPYTLRRQVAERIFRPGTDYNDGARHDQWLEMNEVMSIVAYWKKYSIVVYMVDGKANLKRTFFFIYDEMTDHVTHVVHSHPTRWLSPPPRSITIHYIQDVHFQSYKYNYRPGTLNEIYSVVQKYLKYFS